MDVEATRDLSAAVFGNGKWVEVVLTLDRAGGTPNSQQIARAIGVNSDLVTDVLRRLDAAGLVKALPRIGHPKKGVVPWEVQPGPLWTALLAVARLLVVE